MEADQGKGFSGLEMSCWLAPSQWLGRTPSGGLEKSPGHESPLPPAADFVQLQGRRPPHVPGMGWGRSQPSSHPASRHPHYTILILWSQLCSSPKRRLMQSPVILVVLSSAQRTGRYCLPFPMAVSCDTPGLLSCVSRIPTRQEQPSDLRFDRPI